MSRAAAKREAVAHLRTLFEVNETLFLGLRHARAKLATWATDHNTARPHSALGYLTPAAQAAIENAFAKLKALLLKGPTTK